MTIRCVCLVILSSSVAAPSGGQFVIIDSVIAGGVRIRAAARFPPPELSASRLPQETHLEVRRPYFPVSGNRHSRHLPRLPRSVAAFSLPTEPGSRV